MLQHPQRATAQLTERLRPDAPALWEELEQECAAPKARKVPRQEPEQQMRLLEA